MLCNLESGTALCVQWLTVVFVGLLVYVLLLLMHKYMKKSIQSQTAFGLVCSII